MAEQNMDSFTKCYGEELWGTAGLGEGPRCGSDGFGQYKTQGIVARSALNWRVNLIYRLWRRLRTKEYWILIGL